MGVQASDALFHLRLDFRRQPFAVELERRLGVHCRPTVKRRLHDGRLRRLPEGRE